MRGTVPRQAWKNGYAGCATSHSSARSVNASFTNGPYLLRSLKEVQARAIVAPDPAADREFARDKLDQIGSPLNLHDVYLGKPAAVRWPSG